MSYNFFAMINRMKYIDRWALMRNADTENICEHSHQVAVISHALALIGNKKFGKNHNAERICLLALYHDATEVITGDMPTPVKYFNDDIKMCIRDSKQTRQFYHFRRNRFSVSRRQRSTKHHHFKFNKSF